MIKATFIVARSGTCYIPNKYVEHISDRYLERHADKAEEQRLAPEFKAMHERLKQTFEWIHKDVDPIIAEKAESERHLHLS